jgi:hypothetical protein
MEKVVYKVHAVLDGPVEDPEGNIWLNCKIQGDDDEVFIDDIPFDNVTSAYEFKKRLSQPTLEPVELEFYVSPEKLH